jgi:hypothetical protein
MAAKSRTSPRTTEDRRRGRTGSSSTRNSDAFEERSQTSDASAPPPRPATPLERLARVAAALVATCEANPAQAMPLLDQMEAWVASLRSSRLETVAERKR